MYCGFEMNQPKLGENLNEALEFQRANAKVVCVGLDVRFVDHFMF